MGDETIVQAWEKGKHAFDPHVAALAAGEDGASAPVHSNEARRLWASAEDGSVVVVDPSTEPVVLRYTGAEFRRKYVWVKTAA